MDILIVGVGGQGTLLASRVLGCYAQLSGMACKLSEVHGMSQRGGSVVTHVRMGEHIHAPIVSPGACDLILAFEKLEALRFAHYLRQSGILIVNDQELMPMPVITGAASYPDNIFERLQRWTEQLIRVPAAQIAEQAGSVKTLNIVMLGASAAAVGLRYELLKRAVEMCVPPATVALNSAALEAGYKSI